MAVKFFDLNMGQLPTVVPVGVARNCADARRQVFDSLDGH